MRLTANFNNLISLTRRFLMPLLGLLVGALLITGLPIIEQHPFVRLLELKTYDWRVSMEQGQFAKSSSPDILLLNFDDPTLTLFEDEFGTWPWNRQVHADMMTWLNEVAGVRALAYDMMFTFPKQGSEAAGDRALINAFKRYNNVLFSMNLDQNYHALNKLGKTPDISKFDQIAKGGIEIDSQITPLPVLEFNNARLLLDELMDRPERLALVNHIRHDDGVSRSNPLYFKLQWQKSCPLEKSTDKKQPFSKNSCKPGVTQQKSTLLPYLGVRLLLHLTNPPMPLVLDNNYQLHIGNRVIPTFGQGEYLIRWYNMSAEERLLNHETSKLEHYLQTHPDLDNAEKIKVNQALTAMYGRLSKPFEPYPYLQISAWQVIQAMRLPPTAPEVQQLKGIFKDKIVFVGTTAVSTFDIKTTPIHGALPGVVLQATLFDNLYQNAQHLVQATPMQNLLGITCLWLGCALCIIYTRSVWIGIAGVAVCMLMYVGVAFWLYTHHNLWISMATPIISATLVTILTYMLRYLSRTQDFERTYKLATTDVMTGLKNHRYFQEHLANMVAQTERSGISCALLLVDIDFFKKFNDSYGHQAGDRVLQAVARKLERTVRKGDLVARYGGEEMAVVLANAETPEAIAVAEKLVKAIAEEPYTIAEDVSKHVTISVGVAVCPLHGTAPSDLIAYADAGLYRAKEAGRNRVGTLADAFNGSD